MTPLRRFKPILISLILTSAPLLVGQSTRGTITGKVVDTTGSSVPGATVKATNTAEQTAVEASTDAAGYYVLPQVPLGPYTLLVEAKGFKGFRQEGIIIHVNDKLTIDVMLAVGEVRETVTVSGEAPLLTPESSSLGQVINNRTIVELPLNGRNPFALQQLVAGVIPTGQSGNVNLTRPWDTNSVSDVSVNGAPNRGNMITLNGVYSKGGNQVAYTPSVDAVQEFKVQKNSYDAEAGHVAGGTINVATKSGTNDLHGTMYEFLRNDKFDANNFFANRTGAAKPKFRMNQFGATAGGPLLIPKVYNGKDKTFWFFNWESVRQSTPPATSFTTVPTDAQRGGDFSMLRTPAGAAITLFDPLTVQPDPNRSGAYVRQPFAGNRIPGDRINPIAKAVLGYIPGPNRSGDPTTGAQNYVSSGGGTLQYNQFGGRIDHSFGEKSRIFGFIGVANYSTDNFNLFNNLTTASSGFQNTRSFAVDYVRNFRPDFLMNLRAGFARKYEGSAIGSAGFSPATLGFPQTLVSQLPALVFPQFSIGDATGLGSSGPSYNASDGTNLHAGFTKVKGRHTMKWGTYYLLLREYDGRGSDSGASGQYSFGRNWTQRDPIVGSADSGWGLATFLLGIPSSGQVGVGAFQALQTQYYEFYFQDDWKVTSRLTLNLGMRWEYQGATTDRYDKVVRAFDWGYVPSYAAAAQAAYAKSPYAGLQSINVMGAPIFAGANGQSRSYLNPERDNWAPRIGMAYQVNKRLVWRGGFGIFFNPRLTGVDSSGFNTTTPLITTIDSVTPIASISNPFPNGLNLVPCAKRSPECLTGASFTFRNPNNKTPEVLSYSAGFQYEMQGGWLLEGSYVGSTTRRFNPSWAINAPPVSSLALGTQLLGSVPNPFFGLIPASTGALGQRNISLAQLLAPLPNNLYTNSTSVYGVGHNTFHSAQFSLERRFRNDFSLLSSWTWSKLMAHSNYMNTGFSDQFENMVADIDRTHRVVINGVWELPVGKGKRLNADSAILDHIIGGWQISGVGSFQSGGPIRTPSNAVATGQAVLLANQTIDRWFNTGAFMVQPGVPQPIGQRTLTQYISSFRNKGISNIDMSASKSFKLTERFRLQFRSEFFNALNRVQWGNPDTSITGSNYGKITSQANIPRQIQFGLKLIY
ncbi:MAG: TonB-dependent receptor [Bryobacterales bacterium]|nr:TonB-dependent receptor [Bryobacterales bacterium]